MRDTSHISTLIKDIGHLEIQEVSTCRMKWIYNIFPSY